MGTWERSSVPTLQYSGTERGLIVKVNQKWQNMLSQRHIEREYSRNTLSMVTWMGSHFGRSGHSVQRRTRYTAIGSLSYPFWSLDNAFIAALSHLIPICKTWSTAMILKFVSKLHSNVRTQSYPTPSLLQSFQTDVKNSVNQDNTHS